MKPHQLAVNTVSLRAPLPELLSACAAAGFVNVEFALGQVQHFLQSGHRLPEVVSFLRSLELKCIGGFAGGMTPLKSGADRQANLRFHLENARILAELGGGVPQMMVIGTDGPPLLEWKDPLGTAATMLAEIAAAIEPLNVHVLLEFNWGAIKSLPAAAEVVRLSEAPNAGVLFDPAHYYCTPSKLEQLTAENISTIKHVHVDNMRPVPPELSNCNSDRLLPDDPSGILDLDLLFGTLENHGYNGCFSIEMFSEELWALPPVDAAAKLYQSMQPLLNRSS